MVIDIAIATGFFSVLVFWVWADWIFDHLVVQRYLAPDPLQPGPPASLDSFQWPTRRLALLWLGPLYRKQGPLTWEDKMGAVRRHRYTEIVCSILALFLFLAGFQRGIVQEGLWWIRPAS